MLFPLLEGLNRLTVHNQDALVDGDVVLRSASSEAIGRLASLAGTNFLTAQIKSLVDQVVNNRDPYGRAGCALAFGAIYSQCWWTSCGAAPEDYNQRPDVAEQ